jgi:nucleotide-binding universal stress UspA family protein
MDEATRWNANGTAARGTDQQLGDAETGALGIVVGVDGSSSASRAVQWAAAEARISGLPLRILHAAPYAAGATADAGRERAREVLEAALALARRREPGLWITIRCALEPPVPVLALAATRARLLVLGGADRPNAEPTESVGLRLIEIAECPVVVVQGRARTAGDDRPVVAGVDILDPDAPIVADVLAAAVDAALRLHRPLIVLHAAQVDTPARDLAHDLAARHPGLAVQQVTTAAHPTIALLDAARRAHLLVIGSRGRFAPVRVRTGSTCRDVLRRSTAPVEVITRPAHQAHPVETVPEFSPLSADPQDLRQLW